MGRKVPGSYGLRALPAIILMAALFLVPAAFVFSTALRDNAAPLLATIRDGRTYSVLLFTLWQAFLSALASTAIALPFAAFFANYSFPLRKAVLALAAISFTMPTILTVLGFVIWYGNNGYLNSMLKAVFGLAGPVRILYSFKAIILAHTYLNFPIAFLLITSAWQNSASIEEKASYMLGKGRVRTFISVTLPSIWGSISSSFSMIFLFCFSSFMIVMVLGGHPRYYTLETEIYRRVYIDADIPSAAGLAVFTSVVTSALLALASCGRKEKKAHRSRRELRKARGPALAMAIIMVLLILCFLLPPTLSIIARSLISKSGDFSIGPWKKALEAGSGAIATSFAIAAIAALLASSMASSISLYAAKSGSRLLPLLSSLPLAAGSVTIGLGLLAASTALDLAPALRPLVVLLSHTIIVLPFSVRTVMPGAMKIPERLPAAAAVLGAPERKIISKVEKPLLRPYRKRAFCFAFALSLGEVNATMMISLGRITTLPVLIYDMINHYDYQGAAALGTVLLLEALAVFTIAEWGGKDHGLS